VATARSVDGPEAESGPAGSESRGPGYLSSVPPPSQAVTPVGDAARPSPRPRATYRVQLRREFTFDDAAAQAGYLAELGISHLYLSPVLQAAAGSTHGYDVVDPTHVNVELGGEPGHLRLSDALGRAGLGQLLDIVPNHMAIGGRDNAWWWDVLANGPSSHYASYFDVDWDSPSPRLRNVVMLPILADQYGRELEAGHITLRRQAGDIELHYFDHAAPLDPSSLDTVLLGAARRLAAEPEAPRVELERLAGAAAHLPGASQDDRASIEERHSSGEMLRSRLVELIKEHAAVGAAIDDELEGLNADIDALDRLLDRQNYRLAWWRAAGENLDYRRFFDINDLAAIRVEEPWVFADSHRLILDWLARRVIDGVRVDHIDGLYDPRRYLQRLAEGAPGAWILVEKILEGDEDIPSSWPISGTTGYDWLNRLGDLFAYREGWTRLVEAYRTFAGVTDTYEEIVHQSKELVLGGTLASDLNRVVALMGEVCAKHRRHRDYTRRDLHDVLGEVAAGYAVYRSYVAPDPGDPPDSSEASGLAAPDGPLGRAGRPSTVVASARDVAVVNHAVLVAGMRRPDLDESLLAFVRDILLGRVVGPEESEVALRFQQLTGPVMAKAVEDTAFYRWLALTSLNEVGGDPGRVDDDLDTFHAACIQAQTQWPWAMLATSTHDTKRSEDVRARISVLAEIPDEWTAMVERWWGSVPSMTAGVVPPDRNTAWLLLQTLVGAWPLSAARAAAYVDKATKEAKEHTSWTEPDAFYDEMVNAFALAAVDDPVSRAEVEAIVELVRRPGQAVALAMKLITLTAPGVPDLYQGSELWDLSLVDPDNRRPVDYALLRRARRTTAADAWAGEDSDGLVKLAVIVAGLGVRREHPEWFESGPAGAYVALRAAGSAADHLVAFGRGLADDAASSAGAVTVATRWPLRLERAGGWGDTVLALPPGSWSDRLSGARWSGQVAVGDLLARLPVALLVGAADGD
jgi:(1->4)-alpha-D-glucan 1-alpha-D-glucosylmutase